MKKNRLKLGIIFNFKSGWMGGIIYIINLVKTLDYLEDEEKPEIFLFYNPELERFLPEFDYPYLNPVRWEFPHLIKGTLKSLLLRKNFLINDILKAYTLDAIYPFQDYPVRANSKTKLISWTPDFQHKHYPEFFSKKISLGRHIRIKNTMRNNDDLVLSSHDALNDLHKFYNVRKGFNTHVYHFVSIIENIDNLKIEDLLTKYHLPDKYYVISNQFHKHKNHKVAFLAVAKLKEMGINIHLAITGKFPDASDSPYMAELHSILDDNEIHDRISMLGIISRSEQLQLMRHSQAVLQPSLFEGWSTVIEDARSLQVPVIAANLNVNIEQLGEKGVYFEPHNVEQLVNILKEYPTRNLDDKFYEEYPVRVKEAAETLLEIFKPNESNR